MSTPGTFFANFSLRELVPNAESGPSSAGHWGMGGSVGPIGGATGYRTSSQTNHHKSESLSFPTSVSEADKFDESGFMRSLKRDIEKRIVDCAAVITQEGNIEGILHSSEFHFEYIQGELRGRIVLSGKLDGTTYCLRANLEERSEAGFSLADAFQMMKPEGDYYLNDLALQMYNEGGISLEILKKISGAEMPKGCARTLSGPYLPK